MLKLGLTTLPTDATSAKIVAGNDMVDWLKQKITEPEIVQRFADVLGDDTKNFFSNLLVCVYKNKELQKCSRQSILVAAMDAANMGLPINPSLGMGYILKMGNKDEAQFIPSYRGLIQLMVRSGQLKKLKVMTIFEGEITSYNKFNDQISWGERKSDEVVGYFGYVLLKNGFEHTIYMSKSEMVAYRNNPNNKISKNSTAWLQHFDEMALKVITKKLCKYAPLSTKFSCTIEEY